MKRQPKRQPGWMTALVAVFLCLCGMMQAARAQQTAGQAMLRGTYYQSNGTDTLVLRLIQTGQVISVYGAGTTIVPPQPGGLLGSLVGAYDPVSQQIRLTVQLPRGSDSSPVAIFGSGEGTYNPASRSFSITFTDSTNNEGVTKTYDNVALDTGDTPYMVGIWYWTAAANPGLLFSNPTYGGEFHITSQEPDGRIRGTFGRTNPGDVGTIDGRVSVDQINFTRSGSDANGVPFVQGWGGTRTDDKVGILGVIEQNTPSPWSGDFEARWTYFRNP